MNGKVERSHRVDDQEFYQLLDRDGITDDIPPLAARGESQFTLGDVRDRLARVGQTFEP